MTRLFSIFLLGIPLWAESTTYLYDVYYSWLGKIGEVNATMTREHKQYTITVTGKTVYAGYLASNGWHESHITQGIIRPGKLQPLSYEKRVNTLSKKERSYFLFNHSKRLLKKEYLHREKENPRPWEKQTQSEESWKTVARKTLFESFFPSHELSSFMFDLHNIYPKIPDMGSLSMVVLGGNKKTGHMDITKPTGKVRDKSRRVLGADSDSIIALGIDEDSLQHNAGVLYLLLDDNHFPIRGAVEDVFLFGDIRVIRRD